MLVHIHHDVYQLYKSDTRIEATLEWVVGYIHPSAQDVRASVLAFSEGSYVEVDVPEETVADVCAKFSKDWPPAAALSFALVLAHVLGGKE